jgi:hypothetical protein
MRTWLFAFLLCCLPGGTEAGEVPAGFQGLAWGAAPETLTQRFPAADCQPEKPGSPVADLMCWLEAPTVAGVKTQAVWLSVYLTPTHPATDGFQAYTVYFSSREFDHMAWALRQRYGEVHQRRAQRFKKRAGLRDTNLVLLWTWPTVEVRLERFGGRLDRAVLFVGTRAGRAEAERRIQAHRQLGAHGL